MTGRRRLAVTGALLVLLLALAAVGLLLSRQPELRYADVRPEIEPIEPEMIEIPAGPFLMGNAAGLPTEQPVHEVTLSAYSIGKYEVTNREWRRFADATGRYHPANPLFAEGRNYFLDEPDSPVVEITWSDAAAYCLWLARRTGKDYHLPTEAQWEKAARGGLSGKIHFWGDERLEGMANMNQSWSGGTRPVGSYPANGYGLYDVAGNVNEMVADWYDEDYFQRSLAVDPLGPAGWSNYFSLLSPVGRSPWKGRCKVIKGGSYRAPWDWDSYNPDGMKETPVQVGAREYVYLDPYTHFDLGFRVALGGVWK